MTETKGTGSTGKGSLVATEEMDREDKGTEMVRAGKGPVVQVRAHSGSHCYISGPGQELGGHRGCLKSGISLETRNMGLDHFPFNKKMGIMWMDFSLYYLNYFII